MNKILPAREVVHGGDSFDALVSTWLNSGAKQKSALVKLSIMRNRGELKDLPSKGAIFESLIKNSRNVYFLYDSVTFLASFSKDDELLRDCKKNISQNVLNLDTLFASKDLNLKTLLASLTYVSVYDEQEFERYFDKKKYLKIQEEIRTVFARHPVMMKKRDEFLTEVLLPHKKTEQKSGKKHLSSKDHLKGFIADAPDPVHLLLRKEWAFIPDFVNRNKKLLMTPTLSLQLQELLGEIHSFESFDILLENYLQQQNFRSAITLACCVGSLQIEKLFKALESEKLLDTFLKEIYENIPGDFWSKTKDLSYDEKKNFFMKNYEQILNYVRERAKPIKG